MSVILRLQNLPWSADALDIRRFFHGLSVPDGGVHIVGGEKGDAFVAFSEDEDARRALMLSGTNLKNNTVTLMLSSKAEMFNVIDCARGDIPTSSRESGMGGRQIMASANFSVVPSHQRTPSRDPTRQIPMAPQHNFSSTGNNMMQQNFPMPGVGAAQQVYGMPPPKFSGQQLSVPYGGPQQGPPIVAFQQWRGNMQVPMQQQQQILPPSNQFPPPGDKQSFGASNFPSLSMPDSSNMADFPNRDRPTRQMGDRRHDEDQRKVVRASDQDQRPRGPNHRQDERSKRHRDAPPSKRHSDRGRPRSPNTKHDRGNPHKSAPRKLERGQSNHGSGNRSRTPDGKNDRSRHQRSRSPIRGANSRRRSPDRTEPAKWEEDSQGRRRDWKEERGRASPERNGGRTLGRDVDNRRSRDERKGNADRKWDNYDSGYFDGRREDTVSYTEQLPQGETQHQYRDSDDRRHFQHEFYISLANVPSGSTTRDVRNLFSFAKIPSADIKIVQPGGRDTLKTVFVKFGAEREFNEAMQLRDALYQNQNIVLTVCSPELFDRARDESARGSMGARDRERDQDGHHRREYSRHHDQVSEEGYVVREEQPRTDGYSGQDNLAVQEEYPEHRRREGYDLHHNATRRDGYSRQEIPPSEVRHRHDDHRNVEHRYENTRHDENKQDGYRHDDHQKVERHSPDRPIYTCVMLRNLPPLVERGDILHFFDGLRIGEFGIYIEFDHYGKALGDAFVQFHSHEEYQQAILMHKKTLKGYPIDIYPMHLDEVQERVQGHKNSFKKGRNISSPDRYRDDSLSQGSYRMSRNHSSEDVGYRHVKLSGLPYKADEDMVRTFFGGLKINRVHLIYNNRGLAEGSGFVEFRSSMDCERSLPYDMKLIGKRYIKVLPMDRKTWLQEMEDLNVKIGGYISSNPRQDIQQFTLVKVANIPYRCAMEEILDLLKNYNPVPDTSRMLFDQKGRPSGECLVGFLAKKDALDAIQDLNRKYFKGCMLTLVQYQSHT